MARFGNHSDIFNGANCRFYCWSQSHSDIEIRVRLAKPIEYDDVSVNITADDICIELERPTRNQVQADCCESEIATLVEGQFEHKVDADSAFWVLDKDELSVVIYVDKAENLWWKSLLKGEQAVERGSRNHTVQMEELSYESRVVIDRLVSEQRDKQNTMSSNGDDYNPV